MPRSAEGRIFFRTFLSAEGGDPHSLHAIGYLRGDLPPAFVSWVIHRYSKQGEVVLDPLCGGGVVPLEAALSGRTPVASDVLYSAVQLVRAKLEPVDLVNATLWLQKENLVKPVLLSKFHQDLQLFYHLRTFTEILTLRELTLADASRTAQFIHGAALGILHGENEGYLSALTSSQRALTAKEQQLFNEQREITPGYRAVIPRLLRKTAHVLLDTSSYNFSRITRYDRLTRCDPRALQYLSSESVDLTITSLERILMPGWKQGTWLKEWFSGAPQVSSSLFLQNRGEILAFLLELLRELYRVSREEAKVVLVLPELRFVGKKELLSQVCRKMIEHSLKKHWRINDTLPLPDAPKSPGSTHQLYALFLERR